MAVKKNEKAAENEKTAGNEKEEANIATGNAGEMEPEQPRMESEAQDKVKLAYIGPSLPNAMLKSNAIFEGTREGIKKELKTATEKFPLVEKLLVPVAELAEKKDKVRTEGNILNKYYSDIASSAYAEGRKEG